jgi:hypothetical protein
MSESSDARFADIGRRVQAEVDRVLAGGSWTLEHERALDARFERCAEQAMRVPAFAERSVRVRSVARRLIPKSLRPLVRAGAKRTERLVQTLHRLVTERNIDRRPRGEARR